MITFNHAISFTVAGVSILETVRSNDIIQQGSTVEIRQLVADYRMFFFVVYGTLIVA